MTMHKRLIILSFIIFLALAGMAGLGYHSIRIRAEGMKDKRVAEFADTAEKIKRDIMRKLDDFMKTEQSRPYTDYQYYYIPDNVVANIDLSSRQNVYNQSQVPLLKSPLAGKLEYGFAIGNFQIDSGMNILTANDFIVQREGDNVITNEIEVRNSLNRANIKENLLPVLKESITDSSRVAAEQFVKSTTLKPTVKTEEENQRQALAKAQKSKIGKRKSYQIQSLQSREQPAQKLQQSRAIAEQNWASNTSQSQQQELSRTDAESEQQQEVVSFDIQQQSVEKESISELSDVSGQSSVVDSNTKPESRLQEDIVEVKVEPFVPVVVSGGDDESLFNGQVFLLRNVQVGDKHLLQGFLFNEKKLREEIYESASRLMLKGMDCEISQSEDADSAYTAILDFGFGELILNLKETVPEWISRDVAKLRNWYFGTIAFVFLVVSLGLISLWHNLAAQMKLAQKKDDFISAVSHELRTPLTSIRMYSEMLEKNWVNSKDKLAEYYGNMRQESERLSRLIENVLDFSRIQKGSKKYTFTVGAINRCIESVVEMMSPYAVQNGFSIETDLAAVEQSAFDSDAVTQIVVNLLDNAIKYAREADDKTIIIRTATAGGFITIEVEDHGPGIPHRQRKKVFEQFYRCAAESTRETNGTGLGLALVKKFAQAHDGFVEILTAKPTGSIFKVVLTVQN